MLVHTVETEVIRMAAVHSAGVPHLPAEQGFSVNEIYIPVPVLNRIAVSRPHDLTATVAVRVIGIIASGQHDDRKFRLELTDDAEKLFMRLFQMFRARRIMIVIINKSRKFQFPDFTGKRFLAACGTGKPRLTCGASTARQSMEE